MILFISGGARSGKSSYAEQKAVHMGSIYQKQLLYVAIATVHDAEMEERVKRHRQQRDTIWNTIETVDSITGVLNNGEQDDVVLIDCLTTWLDQALFQKGTSRQEREKELMEWCRISRQKGIHLILVSNDVNEGIPSQIDSVQDYINELEYLHRLWIARADEVIQVTAGTPVYWKGYEMKR